MSGINSCKIVCKVNSNILYVRHCCIDLALCKSKCFFYISTGFQIHVIKDKGIVFMQQKSFVGYILTINTVFLFIKATSS